LIFICLFFIKISSCSYGFAGLAPFDKWLRLHGIWLKQHLLLSKYLIINPLLSMPTCHPPGTFASRNFPTPPIRLMKDERQITPSFHPVHQGSDPEPKPHAS
jgi:hypothetical protein